MKKLISLIIIILCFNVCISQTYTYKEWNVEDEGNWGSFWWKVDRTSHRQTDGYYYFYIYFSSNSYFNKIDNNGNYYKAISYIDNIHLYMNMQGKSPVYLNLQYQLVDWKKTQVAYFYSYAPNPTFYLKYASITPYDYSKVK